MSYVDFEKEQTVWTWVDHESGEYTFDNVHLDNMVYGDTDSGMFKIPDSFVSQYDVEDIIYACDFIGEETNKAFPKFVEHAFNIPPERNMFIRTARETVSDKSLFLSKKRYIMHIIDSEGKRVDKLKIQGVEIKKSNTSKITKRFLKELVDMILDGRSLEDVVDRIKMMETEFKEADIREVATAMNCKTLKTATDTYNLVGNFSGMHYSAKAALIYNINKTDHDKAVRPGDKIGLVYIKHGKQTVLGYPLDLNTLPEWVYQIPLDYDRMWKACNKTITNYLKSLDWDIESRKQELGKKLFGF